MTTFMNSIAPTHWRDHEIDRPVIQRRAERPPVIEWEPDAPDPDRALHDPWQAHALCRGAAYDYEPDKIPWFHAASTADVRRLREQCAGCPVRSECLETALADPGLRGVWGGTTVRERHKIRKQRAAAKTEVAS